MWRSGRAIVPPHGLSVLRPATGWPPGRRRWVGRSGGGGPEGPRGGAGPAAQRQRFLAAVRSSPRIRELTSRWRTTPAPVPGSSARSRGAAAVLPATDQPMPCRPPQGRSRDPAAAPLHGRCTAPQARAKTGRRRSAGPVAQWLEPTAHNGLVAGSSPAGPTTHFRRTPVSRHVPENPDMSAAWPGVVGGMGVSAADQRGEIPILTLPSLRVWFRFLAALASA